MNKFNLKNEILTANKMQGIKGGGEEPILEDGPIGITSGSDPRPKLPTGVIIRGGRGTSGRIGGAAS